MKETLYLKEAKLSGYKSIKDVQIKFQKGINIIIGKNAVGKTNFLSFLHKCLSLDFQDFNNFKSFLSFQNGKNITIETNKNIALEDFFKKSNFISEVESILNIGGKEIKGERAVIEEEISKNSILFDSDFLHHGIAKDYLIVDKPANWIFEKNKISNDLSKILRDRSNPYFLRCFIIDLVGRTIEIDILTKENIKNIVSNSFLKYTKLSEVLAKYSPIQDFRVSDNFNVFVNEDKNIFTLSNLFLEFKIDGQWFPFSSLSDGTKRLFYIISEVFDDYFLEPSPTSEGFFRIKNEVSRIILLEEPELGIHPHQFHLLLEFLKIESKNKQIIITTHAPQALDSIEENELGRIILAYTSNDGTSFRHLNEDELLKAKKYTKENYLSDYWLYSDLEK